MTINYTKYSPTGNVTLLVTSPVPREDHGAVAAALLQRLGGEQVGYVERPGDDRAAARLQMMGGEFCGNAAMSLGALLARQAVAAHVVLEVSGSEGLVPCDIRRHGKGWVGTVKMPVPTAIRTVTLPRDSGMVTAPLVELPGIAHLILPMDGNLGEAQLRRRLPEWNAAIGADALGALLWDESASAIDPLVYVPSAGTLVRENGCGSGSAAVGCWLARRTGHDHRADIRQPGGTIAVDARFRDGAFTSVTITGRVTLVEEGQVDI